MDQKFIERQVELQSTVQKLNRVNANLSVIVRSMALLVTFAILFGIARQMYRRITSPGDLTIVDG